MPSESCMKFVLQLKKFEEHFAHNCSKLEILKNTSVKCLTQHCTGSEITVFVRGVGGRFGDIL